MKGRNLLLITFSTFFLMEYAFTLTNFLPLYYLGVSFGFAAVPLSLLLARKEIGDDLGSPAIQFSVLATAFASLVSFFVVYERSWAVTLPELFFVPVLLEEFNFRYVLQRILLREMRSYNALLLQALAYVSYYSRFVVANHGSGFPFPYNILMLSSVFGMSLVYGLLAMRTRNFIASTTLHFIIWAMFPILALVPGLASSLLPT
ncbi:MAG: CPBP family intramembrane glutamic endopeptidase [Thermoplasmata archaeon]